MKCPSVLAFGLILVCAGAASGQATSVAEDSVRISLVDSDLRGVIQGLGRYLDRPILAGPIGDVRVQVFETPTPVHVDQIPSILRGLVEAHGLVFEETEAFYQVVQPMPAPEPERPAQSTQEVTYRLNTVRLKHARAEDVAATLNQLYGAGFDFSRPAALGPGRLSEQLSRDRGEGREVVGPTESGALLLSPVTIVPDALTNSLLVRSTSADFSVLQEGIEQLDVRPLQVLIEVVLVEARKDRQFTLGFGAALDDYDSGGATVSGDVAGAGLGDLVVRVMGLGKADIDAVISAARTRGDVDIVSRPVILASNNTEASLLVGTQQPFVQVSRSLPTDVPQRDQVVQYRDVGTKLTVRPTINEDGYVSLFVQQELSAATGDVQFNAPVIASREAVTQVLVADRQTIVIGGLRDTVQDRVRTGIPLLADIPVLGGLFGSTRNRTTETELFLFITPTIIDDDETMAEATIQHVPKRVISADFITPGPVSAPSIGSGCTDPVGGCR